MASHAKVEHAVLEHYYDNVLSLEGYLSACLPVEVVQLLVDPQLAPPGCRLLLQETRIAWTTDSSAPRAFHTDGRPSRSLQEVVRRAVHDVLAVSPRTPNVLASGYRLYNGIVTNQTSNTSLADLEESKAWDAVLQHIGEHCLLHLLKNTSIFISIQGGSLRQICGFPIHELPLHGKRARTDCTSIERPVKRQRRNASGISTSAASERLLNRQAIFYANLAKSARSKPTGLGNNNVLNTIREMFPILELEAMADELAPARHLAKHIWPRCFNLAPAVTSHDKTTVAMDKVIMVQGALATPRSLKSALPLLKELLDRHSKLDYARLRLEMLPSTQLKKTELTESDKAELFHAISEDSPLPFTQHQLSESLPSAHDTTTESLATQAYGSSRLDNQAKAQPVPRFVDFTIPHHRVAKFLHVCVRRVLPKALLGSKENMQLLELHIKAFVSAKRYETFSVHQLMQGIAVKAVTWVFPQRKASRTASTAMELARHNIEDLLVWIFDHYVIDLLRSNFYITESAATHRKTLYFLQNDWHTICTPLVDHMTKTLFRPISEEEGARVLQGVDRKLGFSHVRFLPKERGVRPIVNLSRRPATGQSGTRGLSINQILQNAFAILTFERDRHTESVGSSTMAFVDVYRRLKAYKSLQAATSGGNSRLYMVKLDIRACFDTIDQRKLLQILEIILQEEEYSITRYVSLTSTHGKVVRRFAKQARAADEFAQFPEIAFQAANALRNSVFVDQMRPCSEDRQAVMRLLREHITGNIIKIGSHHYSQEVGIPQGSILSTLLCNFFYGHMESRQLSFIRNPHSVLLRLVDDFLLISTEKASAERFLREMSAGHPDYGCFIAQDKTLVNFDVSLTGAEPVRRINPTEAFPWCGHLLDQRTLEVRYDYARLAGGHLSNAMTVRTHKQPGKAFVDTMLGAMKIRISVIFCDTDFCRMQTAYLNIYQAFQLVAMKYHAYISMWRPNIERNIPFFLNAVHQIVSYAFRAVKACFSPKIVAECKATRKGLRRSYIYWLGYHAFVKILSRKSTRHATLLKQLKLVCALPSYCGAKQTLRPVLAHPSNKDLLKIRY